MVLKSIFVLALLATTKAFSPTRQHSISHHVPHSKLCMAMDDAMIERLSGIRRSYQALTERLGDPDVIADSKLLMKVMSDRSKSEAVVTAFDEVRISSTKI